MYRFPLTLGSFVLIVGTYVLYEQFVVPVMLPEQKSRVFEDRGTSERLEELAPYLALFPEGWERDSGASIQKLQIDQTVILFLEDEVDGNFIKLKPCTILFLDGDPALSEEERIRQAFVMRTQQYAEIEFDDEVNFSRLPPPNIKGGKLIGKVSIHSDMKEPGPQDDVYLETENIVFIESPAKTTISTLKDVSFRWGTNSGEGSVLHIELDRLDPKNKTAPKELSRLQFDTLRRLNMILSEGGGHVATAPPKPATVAPKTEAKVPPLPKQPPLPPIGVADSPKTATIPLGAATKLDVNCKREFVFIPDRTSGNWAANFFGNVKAVRTNPDGSTDQITGEELQVVFTPKKQTAKQDPKAKTPPPKAENPAGLGSMEPILFTIRGKMGFGNQPPDPARLTSKQSGGIIMVGDRIQYDLQKNQLLLETETAAGASKEVLLFLQDNRYVFRSTKGFFYTMDPNGGIGHLTSASPGSLQGALGEGNQLKKVSATWKSLQTGPDKFDPKQMVVFMDGGIMFEMQGLGKMTAEKFYLWCQAPQESPPNRTTDTLFPGGIGTLTPDSAKALGKVHFENESGTCDVNQMDICFETVAPNGSVQRSRRLLRSLDDAPPTVDVQDLTAEKHSLPPLARTSSQVVSPEHRLIATESRIQHASNQAVRQVQHLELQNFETPPQPRPATFLPPVASQGPLPPMTTTPATTANAPVTKLEPHGLSGLLPGTSRSFYAITGDRMEMLVRTIKGRSEPSNIHIYGNVRVAEKLIGSNGSEAVEILGEEIKIWNPTTPDTQIQIKGKPPRDAEFRGKGAKLNAMEINILRAENLIWSDGAGRLLANVPAQGGGPPSVVINQGNAQPGLMPLSPLGMAKPGGDGRLVVEWNEKMSFDGKTLLFQGKPDSSGIRTRAFFQNTSIVADLMRLHLNRLVSLFNDQSELPAKAESIECVKNVFIRTEEIDDQRRKSVSTIFVDGVRIYVETGDFAAIGPGEIQRTFVNDGKGFAPPGSSTTKALQTDLAHLYVRFHKEVRGNYLTNFVEITGTVLCMHCPADSWGTKLGIEDQNSVIKRGYSMDCEKLLIFLMPTPGGETQSVELTASGRTKIEGINNLYAGAETIKYNQAKGLIVFEGDSFGKATVHAGKKGGVTAQKLEYNMETGNVQILDAGGQTIER